MSAYLQKLPPHIYLFHSPVSNIFRVDRSTLSNVPEDFQVRVRIIKARQLVGTNIKPTVKIKAGEETKNTRIRKGSSPIWNEVESDYCKV